MQLDILKAAARLDRRVTTAIYQLTFGTSETLNQLEQILKKIIRMKHTHTATQQHYKSKEMLDI